MTALKSHYVAPGLSFAMIVLALDQISKYILLVPVNMPSRQFIEITPFFNLVMTWNKGVSFGLLKDFGTDQQTILIIMTSLIVLVLVQWLQKTTEPALAFALGAVIGGAVGNITDRVRFGAVADFFDLHLLGYHWPAFNIADMAICLGVAALLWDAIVVQHRKPRLP